MVLQAYVKIESVKRLISKKKNLQCYTKETNWFELKKYSLKYIISLNKIHKMLKMKSTSAEQTSASKYRYDMGKLLLTSGQHQ